MAKTIIPGKKFRGRSIFYYYKRIKLLVNRYRHFLLMGIIALIATDLMGMAIPWLIKGGIDNVIQEKNASLYLWAYPFMILLSAIAQGLFRYLWRTNIYGFSRRVECDLRDEVFSHLLKLPIAYFQHMKTGDLMSRLTNDMQSIRELLGRGALAVVDSAIVISGSLTFMIAIDPMLTFWSLLFLPFISLSVRFFGGKIFFWSRDAQQHLSLLSTYVQEDIAGIRVVQAYAQEENRIHGFNSLSVEYLQKNLRLAALWGVLWPLMRLFTGIAAGIVLWIGGDKVLRGEMTLGEFAAFNGYLGMLTWPVMAVGHLVNQYQRGAAALSRIIEILDTPIAPDLISDQAYSSVPIINGRIEIKNLSFSYPYNPHKALKNISLTIPAGSTCGIIGETGSGKSTLVHLILRLWEPPRDSIFVDGMDITSLPTPYIRNATGFVSQDIFLFSDTIAQNISFGCQHCSMDLVEKSARMAQLSSTINDFSDNFNTVLGERGVRLSGGQKQRTALARALIKNPAILILDDAFSSIDTETEEEILSQLGNYIKNRTTLMISHRISTIKNADIIIYMRNGLIVEQGTHDELVNLRGAYYRLYRKQQLAKEVQEISREVTRS